MNALQAVESGDLEVGGRARSRPSITRKLAPSNPFQFNRTALSHYNLNCIYFELHIVSVWIAQGFNGGQLSNPEGASAPTT